MRDNKGRFVKGNMPWCTGKKRPDISGPNSPLHSLEARAKASAKLKGHTSWNKGKTGVYSEETLKKMSKAQAGKRVSEEARKKQSLAKLGKTPWNKNKHGYMSEKGRKHISDVHKGNKRWVGRRHSEATKRRLSLLNTGKKRTKETKSRISKSNKGRKPWNTGKYLGPRTEEVKKRISSSKKGTVFSEEHKARISSSCKGKLCGEKNPSWKGGTSFLPYCSKFNNTLKERIRERDNRTCQLCGIKENGRKLSIHHIHYDKHNCEPDLIALCLKCNNTVNINREYYELLFIDKLRTRGLLL